MNTHRKNIRFVDVRGARYLRAEDVEDLIRELGVGEETDVRRRLDEAARNLAKARMRSTSTTANATKPDGVE